MESPDNYRLISVIINVYNRENVVSRAIESILAQKEVETEVIIVDDGSTDNTLNICREYEKNNENVRVIHQENSGLEKSRNTGLDNAHGKYVCFLDDDDVMTPGSLKVMYDAAEWYDVDFVAGNFERVSEAGDKVADSNMPENVKNRVITPDEYWEASFDRKGYFIFIVNWAKLYKRSIWDSLRFPENLRKAQDEYVLADILGRCERIYVTDYIVHRQTLSKNSITRSKFGLVTLRAPETKLISAEKLINQRKYKYAVKKWGISCGEILTYTKSAGTGDIKAEVKRLYAWSCKLGKDLFKYMDIKKKVKYLGYRYGYTVFRGLFMRKK
ncbi:MAG: glycosyltransferase family 2 protein [Lachnospiraceae bacterium]|nr:glycosyltransferase family 2 protein [Lachnospiraceae bacterium]